MDQQTQQPRIKAIGFDMPDGTHHLFECSDEKNIPAQFENLLSDLIDVGADPKTTRPQLVTMLMLLTHKPEDACDAMVTLYLGVIILKKLGRYPYPQEEYIRFYQRAIGEKPDDANIEALFGRRESQ